MGNSPCQALKLFKAQRLQGQILDFQKGGFRIQLFAIQLQKVMFMSM